MNEHLPTFRVFLSLPSDVGDEREVILQVLANLTRDAELRDQVQVVSCDRLQRSGGPTQCELTVVVLGEQLAQPEADARTDTLAGDPHETQAETTAAAPPSTTTPSHTEQDVEDALQHGKHVLIYYKRPDDVPNRGPAVDAFIEAREHSLDGAFYGSPQPIRDLAELAKRFESDIRNIIHLQLMRWRGTSQAFSQPPIGYDNNEHPDGTPFNRFGRQVQGGARIVLCYAQPDTALALEFQRVMAYQGLRLELSALATFPGDPKRALQESWREDAQPPENAQPLLLFLLSHHCPFALSLLPNEPPRPGLGFLSLDTPAHLPLTESQYMHWSLRSWWLLGDGRNVQSCARWLAQKAGYALSPINPPRSSARDSADIGYLLGRRSEYLDRWRDYLAARRSHYPNADIALAALELAQSKAINERDGDIPPPTWTAYVYKRSVFRFAPLKNDEDLSPHVTLALNSNALEPTSPPGQQPAPLLVVLKAVPPKQLYREGHLLRQLQQSAIPHVAQLLDGQDGALLLPFYRYGDLHHYADLADDDYPQDRRDIWAAIRKVWRSEAAPWSTQLVSDISAQAQLLHGFVTLIDALLATQQSPSGQGYVHRDIKPTNILVEAPGTDLRLRLADFQFACVPGRQRDSSGKQLKPPFAAPEATTAPRANTDVYSLGLTLASVLLRRMPPADGRAQAQQEFLNEAGPHGRYLHHALLDILFRALTPEPGRRPSLTRFRADLIALHEQILQDNTLLLVTSRWESLIDEVGQRPIDANRSPPPPPYAGLALELLSTARDHGADSIRLPSYRHRNASTGTPAWFLAPYRDDSVGQSRIWCFASVREWRGNSPGRRLLGWDRGRRHLVFVKASATAHEATKLRHLKGVAGCVHLEVDNRDEHWFSTTFVHRGTNLQQASGLTDQQLSLLTPVRRHLQPLGIPWVPSNPSHQRRWLRVLLDLIDTLQRIQERGIYHCDVKPANILLSCDDPAKLPPSQSSITLCDFDTAFTVDELRTLEADEVYRLERNSKFLPTWLVRALTQPQDKAQITAQLAARVHTTAVASTMAALAWVRHYPKDEAATLAEFVAKSPLVDALRTLAEQAVSEPGDVRLNDLRSALAQRLQAGEPFAVSEQEHKRRIRRRARSVQGLARSLRAQAMEAEAPHGWNQAPSLPTMETRIASQGPPDRLEIQERLPRLSQDGLRSEPAPGQGPPAPPRVPPAQHNPTQHAGRTSFIITSLLLPLLAAIAVATFVRTQRTPPVHDEHNAIRANPDFDPPPRRSYVTIDGAELITGDVVWERGTRRLLKNTVVVAPGAKLTIEPGTTLYMDRDSMLVVAPGAQLHASGTADAPIIFKPRPEELPLRGYWRGLAILGCGKTLRDPENTYAAAQPASSASATGPFACEGAPLNTLEACVHAGHPCGYGSAHSADRVETQGVLRYVVISHGGTHIGTNSEANSLSLAGLTRAFTVQHVVALHSRDDCIEFFGGDVLATHLTCIDAEDDSFDATLGYQGAARYLYASNRPTDTRVDCAYGRNGIEVEIEASRDDDQLALAQLRQLSKPLFMDVVLRQLNPGHCSGSYAVRSPDRVDVANLWYEPGGDGNDATPARVYSGEHPSLGASWTLADSRAPRPTRHFTAQALAQQLPRLRGRLEALAQLAPDSDFAEWEKWTHDAKVSRALPPWYRPQVQTEERATGGL